MSEALLNSLCTRRAFLRGGVAGVSAVALGGCLGREPEARRPSILLFLSDTLRADHLGAYGYRIATSPHIDAFAERSAVFDCYATAPWTKPSVASLLTGVVPRVHLTAGTYATNRRLYGEKGQVQVLREGFRTLPEIMQAQGYSTGYFMSNPHTQDRFGFAQGFDTYRYALCKPDELATLAIEWLQQQPADAPVFAYVHTIEPHGPYRPEPDTFAAMFGQHPDAAFEALPRSDKEQLETLRMHYSPPEDGVERPDRPTLAALNPEGNGYLQQMYDAEIRGMDAAFKRLLDAFDTLRPEGTVTAFTSDHGEGFGEHGKYFHRYGLDDELIRVPLIIGGTGIEAGRWPYTVSQLDVFPTLAAFAGGESPDYVQGRPLFAWDDGRARIRVTGNRDAFASHDFYQMDAVDAWDVALVSGEYKAVYRGATGAIALYDRSDEPLPMDHPEASVLVERLKAGMAEHARLAEQFGPPELTGSNEETRRDLEALGYLH